jgi:hypothetical protein
MEITDELITDEDKQAAIKRGGFRAGHLMAVHPNLFELLVEHLSRTVKPLNLFLRGESSTGKTYNTTEALKYFPQEDVWILGGLSPAALIHEYGDLVDENGNPILPSEKPDKKAPAEEKDRWREKLRNSRYIVDLRGKILVFLEAPHRRTYNMLRPILSHDKFEISYKITDPEKLKTKHTVIRGWPATIFCSSEERHIKDLVSRGFTVTPEIAPEKYREANLLTGMKSAYPWKFDEREDRDLEEFRSYFRWLKYKLVGHEEESGLGVCVPYAQQLATRFPSDYARVMRA